MLKVMAYTILTTFAAINTHVMPGTLVALDIDETVLRFPDEIGTPHWWKQAFKWHYIATGGDYDEADERSYQTWLSTVSTMAPLHTDEIALKRLMAETWQAGNRVIAVTARRLELANMTQGQLAGLGIAFDDIFFAGKQPKETVLKRICAADDRIRRLIFVDDQEPTIKNVAAAFAGGMPVPAELYVARVL